MKGGREGGKEGGGQRTKNGGVERRDAGDPTLATPVRKGQGEGEAAVELLLLLLEMVRVTLCGEGGREGGRNGTRRGGMG